MLAVGLFAEKDLLEGFSSYAGLFRGGGFYLLGVQLLACVCCIVWSGSLTFLLIKVILSIVILQIKNISQIFMILNLGILRSTIT